MCYEGRTSRRSGQGWAGRSQGSRAGTGSRSRSSSYQISRNLETKYLILNRIGPFLLCSFIFVLRCYGTLNNLFITAITIITAIAAIAAFTAITAFTLFTAITASKVFTALGCS